MSKWQPQQTERLIQTSPPLRGGLTGVVPSISPLSGVRQHADSSCRGEGAQPRGTGLRLPGRGEEVGDRQMAPTWHLTPADMLVGAGQLGAGWNEWTICSPRRSTRYHWRRGTGVCLGQTQRICRKRRRGVNLNVIGKKIVVVPITPNIFTPNPTRPSTLNAKKINRVVSS